MFIIYLSVLYNIYIKYFFVIYDACIIYRFTYLNILYNTYIHVILK